MSFPAVAVCLWISLLAGPGGGSSCGMSGLPPPGLQGGSGRAGLPLPPRQDPEDLFQHAQKAFSRGDHERARSLFERVVRLDPLRRDSRTIVAYYDERSGFYGRAWARFAELAREDPSDAYAWREEAKAALSGGDLRAASESLRRAGSSGGKEGSDVRELQALLAERVGEQERLDRLRWRHVWGTGLLGLAVVGGVVAVRRRWSQAG